MPLDASRYPRVVQFILSNTRDCFDLPGNDQRRDRRDFLFSKKVIHDKLHARYYLKMFSTVTQNPEATKRVGKNLGQNLSAGSIVALTGELGSGKTTLVQGIGEGLRIKSLIKSPTFVIINEYDGPLPLYHFDLYRLDNAEEIISMGCEEYFYEKGGVVAIEWAKKIEGFLPKEYLEIDLKIINLAERRISGQAHGASYKEVIEKMEKLFCSC